MLQSGIVSSLLLTSTSIPVRNLSSEGHYRATQFSLRLIKSFCQTHEREIKLRGEKTH